MYCNCHSGQVDLICLTPFPPSLLFYWEFKLIVYLLESPRKNASGKGGDLFYFDILLGWDGGGASFVNQSQRSKVKPKQFKVTFDTKLKTALIVIIVISVKMKAIFAVMNTTWAVVKIRPKKKNQACTGFEPMTFLSGLIFTTAQVVYITAKISFIFTSLSAVKTYDFHIFTIVYCYERRLFHQRWHYQPYLLGLQRFQSWITFCYVLILLRLNFVTS